MDYEKIDVATGNLVADLAIGGLCFESNEVSTIDEGDAWFSQKIASSPGPMVSDFVTHGPDFEYSTLGIHVGQDDRLTFFGDPNQSITGDFVDCREGSPTLHKRVKATFTASPDRRLIIPRGVAHTFDNLQGIVTRDEPVWHASDDNPHWNVNNDLVSILRSEMQFPVVQVNEYRLPDELHLYLTQLSQDVLSDPKPYSTRFRLKIGGVEQYVMFQENAWNEEGRAIAPLLAPFDGTPVQAVRSNFAITGKASWTLVPNTRSAVADVLLLKHGSKQGGFYVHHRTRRYYTILTGEGAEIEISMIDLRAISPKYGEVCSIKTIADPRVTYVIEPGIAYRFDITRDHYFRSENEVFVAEDEPREDLPPIGRDLFFVEGPDELPALDNLPTLRCPDRIVRQMARFEIEPG